MSTPRQEARTAITGAREWRAYGDVLSGSGRIRFTSGEVLLIAKTRRGSANFKCMCSDEATGTFNDLATEARRSIREHDANFEPYVNNIYIFEQADIVRTRLLDDYDGVADFSGGNNYLVYITEGEEKSIPFPPLASGDFPQWYEKWRNERLSLERAILLGVDLIADFAARIRRPESADLLSKCISGSERVQDTFFGQVFCAAQVVFDKIRNMARAIWNRMAEWMLPSVPQVAKSRPSSRSLPLPEEDDLISDIKNMLCELPNGSRFSCAWSIFNFAILHPKGEQLVYFQGVMRMVMDVR